MRTAPTVVRHPPHRRPHRGREGGQRRRRRPCGCHGCAVHCVCYQRGWVLVYKHSGWAKAGCCVGRSVGIGGGGRLPEYQLCCACTAGRSERKRRRARINLWRRRKLESRLRLNFPGPPSVVSARKRKVPRSLSARTASSILRAVEEECFSIYIILSSSRGVGELHNRGGGL